MEMDVHKRMSRMEKSSFLSDLAYRPGPNQCVFR